MIYQTVLCYWYTNFITLSKLWHQQTTYVIIVLLLCIAALYSLHSSMNQEVFEKHLCNKSSHYEKYGRFLITQRKPSHATTKLMLFTPSEDEWNTKEDTGKSLKNALHVLQCAKRHLSGWSDVEQWKNQARSVSRYQVMLVWRHQAGRQLVSQC